VHVFLQHRKWFAAQRVYFDERGVLVRGGSVPNVFLRNRLCSRVRDRSTRTISDDGTSIRPLLLWTNLRLDGGTRLRSFRQLRVRLRSTAKDDVGRCARDGVVFRRYRRRERRHRHCVVVSRRHGTDGRRVHRAERKVEVRYESTDVLCLEYVVTRIEDDTESVDGSDADVSVVLQCALHSDQLFRGAQDGENGRACSRVRRGLVITIVHHGDNCWNGRVECEWDGARTNEGMDIVPERRQRRGEWYRRAPERLRTRRCGGMSAHDTVLSERKRVRRHHRNDAIALHHPIDECDNGGVDIVERVESSTNERDVLFGADDARKHTRNVHTQRGRYHSLVVVRRSNLLFELKVVVLRFGRPYSIDAVVRSMSVALMIVVVVVVGIRGRIGDDVPAREQVDAEYEGRAIAVTIEHDVRRLLDHALVVNDRRSDKMSTVVERTRVDTFGTCEPTTRIVAPASSSESRRA